MNSIFSIFGTDSSSKEVHLGTAFYLSSGYLVTAAHTYVRGGEKQYFYLNGEKQYLKAIDPPYYRKPKTYYTADSKTYYDLVYFKICLSDIKGLELDISPLANGTITKMCGFGEHNGTMLECKELVVKNSSIVEYETNDEKNIRPYFENIIQFTKDESYGGDSGCPVFLNNKVVGMVILGDNEDQEKFGTIAIKASYINEILSGISTE